MGVLFFCGRTTQFLSSLSLFLMLQVGFGTSLDYTDSAGGDAAQMSMFALAGIVPFLVCCKRMRNESLARTLPLTLNTPGDEHRPTEIYCAVFR